MTEIDHLACTAAAKVEEAGRIREELPSWRTPRARWRALRRYARLMREAQSLLNEAGRVSQAVIDAQRPR